MNMNCVIYMNAYSAQAAMCALSVRAASRHHRPGTSIAGSKEINLMSVPYVSCLQTILTALGMAPTDLTLRLGPSSLQFGISKAYVIALPDPFTGPANTTFSLALDSQNQGVALAGTFAAALRIGGVRDPVGLDMAASIGMTVTNGVSLSMAGATTTEVQIDAAPFIQIGPLFLSATVTPSPLVIHQMTLAGNVTVFGQSGSGVFFFDKNTKALAMTGELNKIDIQQMLSSILKANVSLGECLGPLCLCCRQQPA